MLDRDGYRPNVGIILSNSEGQVLWARRVGQDAWQFPQGGIKRAESIEDALFRELLEEVGVSESAVEVLDRTRGWLRYRLPKRLRRQSSRSFVGQKQKWFLLRYTGENEDIRFDQSDKPEFDQWQWVSYWYPLGQVVAFKRDVYRRAMKELAPSLAKSISH